MIGPSEDALFSERRALIVFWQQKNVCSTRIARDRALSLKSFLVLRTGLTCTQFK
jgi:hypothetical protein